MTAIREWLETLGLAQYADLFEREQIDLDAACHLTELASDRHWRGRGALRGDPRQR